MVQQLQLSYLIALELNGERVAVHDQLDVGSAIDVEERGALLALVLPARAPVHTERLLACEAVSVRDESRQRYIYIERERDDIYVEIEREIMKQYRSGW
jgi:hypothetical protein